MSEQILTDLKRHEGWRPSVYQDHLGYWTLGFGFMVDERKQGRIPHEVGHYWLAWEVDRITARLSMALDWFDDAPEPVQRALVNMAYQLGVSGLLRFRNTLALLQAGKYQDAAAEALRSRWAEQTPKRAQEVAGWIRGA